MAFSQKDGYFHFLFAQQEELCLSDSLLFLTWQEWVRLTLLNAGYQRVLFLLPSAPGKVLVIDHFHKKKEDPEGTKISYIGLLGSLLGKPEHSGQFILSRLDTEGKREFQEGDCRNLIRYIFTQKTGEETAFVVPIPLFADLYKSRIDQELLGQCLFGTSTPGPASLASSGTSRPVPSVMVLTGTLDAADSLPWLTDREGVFASTALFPEMAAYVWSESRPGSFYKRLTDAFTANRVVRKDPLDRQTLRRLLLRRFYVDAGTMPDPVLLEKEIASLYVILHNGQWGRILRRAAAESGKRWAYPDEASETGYSLRRLDELLREQDLMAFLKWSVEVFEEKYGTELSIMQVFGKDCIPFDMPILRRGTVTEYEVLWESARAFSRMLEQEQGEALLAAMERIERYLYIPWEDTTPVQTAGDVPDGIRNAIVTCTGWMDSYREYGIRTFESITGYLERLIIRSSGDFHRRSDPDTQGDIAATWRQLIDIELAVADAEKKQDYLSRMEEETAGKIGKIVKEMKELGQFDPEIIRSKTFKTSEERLYLKLDQEFTVQGNILKKTKSRNDSLRSDLTTLMDFRNEIGMLLKTTGSPKSIIREKEVKSLLAHLQHLGSGLDTLQREDEGVDVAHRDTDGAEMIRHNANGADMTSRDTGGADAVQQENGGTGSLLHADRS